MQIVLATRNQHKKQELVALLGGMDITIRTLDDFPDAPDVVEDGETCEANAMKKAVEIARYTGLPAVADDTGLEVDALGGRPGAFAARYAGEQASYEDNWRKLLQELRGVPAENRGARFVTVAAIALSCRQDLLDQRGVRGTSLPKSRRAPVVSGMIRSFSCRSIVRLWPSCRRM
jgi:XTP/dITP diphosphohydrolase